MKTLKTTILAFFCAGLLTTTTSCNRGTGCGTWGKVKSSKKIYGVKPKNNNQYAAYKKYNS